MNIAGDESALAADSSRNYTSAPVVRSDLHLKTDDNKRHVSSVELDQKGEVATVARLQIG